MRENKMKKPIFILFALLGLLTFFVACSNNDDDDSGSSGGGSSPSSNYSTAVSLEGTALTSSEFNIRFVGAKTAYVTMKNSRISDDENLYSYTATADTITLQLQKIASPTGSGGFLTKDEFKSLWESEEWEAYYILKDIKSLYQEEKRTITDDEDTVYTYKNKITYTISDGNETETRTTSGTKKTAEGVETSLFTGVPGYTDISSTYDASEFAYVTSVKVYSDSDEEITEHAMSFKGAEVSDWENSYGSDDADAKANIKLKNQLFELTKADLSNDNWNLLEAMFKPISFSYKKDYTVSEGDEAGTKYDFYLTQRYTDFETALFANESEEGEIAYATALCYSMYGLALVAPTSESSSSPLSLAYLSSTDSAGKILTFYSISSNGDSNPNPENVSLNTITASYTVSGSGEKTTVKLVFAEKADSSLSKKEFTLTYQPISYGMTLSDNCY